MTRLLAASLVVIALAACPGPSGLDAGPASADRLSRDALGVDAIAPDHGATDHAPLDAAPTPDAAGIDRTALSDAQAVDRAAVDGAVAVDVAPVDHAPAADAMFVVDAASSTDAARPDAVAGTDAAGDAATSDDANAVDANTLDAAAPPCTLLRVHYDTGYGNRIAIRGQGPALSWTADAAASWSAGNVWVYETTAIAAATEFKPVFVDGDGALFWAVGPNWVVQPGQTLDLAPFFFAAAGTLDSFAVTSIHLGDDRQVEVYLPPSYGEAGAAGRTYPLLIMQDGQNLFDPQAFFGGWALDQALDDLLLGTLTAGGVRDVIVAAPHNGGLARIYEYTPTAGATDYCTGPGDCGGADAYLDFVVDELLPALGARYRVAPGRVGIAGSSLGGLVSLYACWTRPAHFDRCGVFSPSLWWDAGWMLDQVASDPGPRRALWIYVDAGTVSDGLANVLLLAGDLASKPGDLAYTVGEDLLCLQGVRHEHNELAWRIRAPWALEWLYHDPDRLQPAPARPVDVVPCAP